MRITAAKAEPIAARVEPEATAREKSAFLAGVHAEATVAGRDRSRLVGRAFLVSSAALKLAGIDRSTPTPRACSGFRPC